MRGWTAISAAAALTAGLALPLGLAGCTAGPMIDSLPANVGLPAGAPERPVTPYQYPAVHDMPPPRATPAMSEEEQVRVEKELSATRDRQEAREGKDKKPAATPKRKPAKNAQDAAAKDGTKDGAKGGAKINP